MSKWSASAWSLAAAAVWLLAACAGQSAEERASLDYRYASFEPKEIIFGPPERSVLEGVPALPDMAAWGAERRLSDDRLAEGFGPFTIIEDSAAAAVVEYAAGGIDVWAGVGADTFAVALGAFVDEDGRVAAQWLTDADAMITVVMEVDGPLPMSNEVLARQLDAAATHFEHVRSASYTVDYERLWEDTTVEDPATGVRRTGDQAEFNSYEVTTDLGDTSVAATDSWTLTTDGVSSGAISHVEHRYVDGRHFRRLACSVQELDASPWSSGPHDQSWESLETPAYVPALLERIVEPKLTPSAEGTVRIEFSLRRFGLLGQPWPLWSYGDDWDIEGALVVDSDGVPLTLTIESSRGRTDRAGPGTDSVLITFGEWDAELSVEPPANVVEGPSVPTRCGSA